MISISTPPAIVEPCSRWIDWDSIPARVITSPRRIGNELYLPEYSYVSGETLHVERICMWSHSVIDASNIHFLASRPQTPFIYDFEGRVMVRNSTLYGKLIIPELDPFTGIYDLFKDVR